MSHQSRNIMQALGEQLPDWALRVVAVLLQNAAVSGNLNAQQALPAQRVLELLPARAGYAERLRAALVDRDITIGGVCGSEIDAASFPVLESCSVGADAVTLSYRFSQDFLQRIEAHV